MSFKQSEAETLLAQCHRRCCICHQFCGTKIELDHMKPRAEGGTDAIDNAIAVCFACHAEIHCYNPEHPRGRKFREAELRQHKQQWLAICREQPQMLLAPVDRGNVGPLQALVDEIEFNCLSTQPSWLPVRIYSSNLHDEQFRRAIHSGSVSLLDEDLKESIMQAYQCVGIVNYLNGQIAAQPFGNTSSGLTDRADTAVKRAKTALEAAREKLLEFLAPEDKTRGTRDRQQTEVPYYDDSPQT